MQQCALKVWSYYKICSCLIFINLFVCVPFVSKSDSWPYLCIKSFTHFVLFFTAANGLAEDCRVGHGEYRPYSGATVVCDFCAHPHRDGNNMHGGCTCVITLTKPENRDSVSNEEQFHGKILTSQSQIDKLTKMAKQQFLTANTCSIFKYTKISSLGINLFA